MIIHSLVLHNRGKQKTFSTLISRTIFIFPSSSVFYQVLCIYPLFFFLTTKRRFADSSKNVVCCSVAFSNSAFSPESGVSQLEKHWVNLQAQTMKHRLKSSVLVSRRLWRDEHYCFDANNFHFKPGKITLNWVLKLNHNCLAMPERD